MMVTAVLPWQLLYVAVEMNDAQSAFLILGGNGAAPVPILIISGIDC